MTTSVTIQDSINFYNRFDQDSGFISDSILNILENNQIDVVKIGMLANLKICQEIFSIFHKSKVRVVLDPVFKSTSGGALLDLDAMEFLREKILPICYVITPNIAEAELLTDQEIINLETMRDSCKALKALATESNIIIKGGHLENSEFSTDILYENENRVHVEQVQRVNNKLRGSGCRFATAVACNLILGKSLQESFLISKKLIASLFNQEKNVTYGELKAW